VLAMMFLVIFGSLAAAMAVVAQGNLRTADSAMKVSRAMSAAETGLVFATRRLAEQSNRFVVEKGVIDGDYGHDLWLGTFDIGADGEVVVLPPDGYIEPTDPQGVAEAILFAHQFDAHSVDIAPGDGLLPHVDGFGTLRVKPIALTAHADGAPDGQGPYFRLKYELIAGQPYVRVTSQGVDGDITRTLQMDFFINKRIEYAIIAPSRIMIGKNVRVEGPLGSRYGTVDGELDSANGDPLVMRSDFYWLNVGLDSQLDILFEQVAAHDADGDGRLRLYHPEEALGIAAGGGQLIDYDGNEYVDDFDLFMRHYDANSDNWVVYDQLLANDAGLGLPAEEFADIDDQMARLIDEANPDRDGDGIVDEAPGSTDRMLGYRDRLPRRGPRRQGPLRQGAGQSGVRGHGRRVGARSRRELPDRRAGPHPAGPRRGPGDVRRRRGRAPRGHHGHVQRLPDLVRGAGPGGLAGFLRRPGPGGRGRRRHLQPAQRRHV
jgi:hypothetical protein